MRKHYLKTWPEYFEAVKKHEKKFEIRVNDRDFRKGDILILQEYDPKTNSYTGATDITAVVTYILSGPPFLPEDYVCMSISILGEG
jgi:ASC-1-like (ASCH) protein